MRIVTEESMDAQGNKVRKQFPVFATLSEYLVGRGDMALTNHDLASLADWANTGTRNTPNTDWKRAYSLLREGADLLLRRRARSTDPAHEPDTATDRRVTVGYINGAEVQPDPSADFIRAFKQSAARSTLEIVDNDGVEAQS